jgi:tyrosyl-tRNA synthetase
MLKNAEMTASTSEAMRLIKQGGVKINSEKVSDVKLEIEKGSEAIYQVGKRKFLKIKIK